MHLFAKLTFYLSGFFEKANAQVNNPTITLTNPLGSQSFTDVVNKVADFLITVSIPIAAIMVLWGGFQMMTAAGDPEKFKSGRQTILYAAIGLAVVLAAKSVVVLIKNVLGAQ